MVIMGFLAKGGERFSLTTDSALFLDKQSPAYAGFATRFLTSPLVTENFRDLATVVRTGKPLSGEALTKAEHPAWVDFARSMAPLLLMAARETEKLVRKGAPMKVLDVAADTACSASQSRSPTLGTHNKDFQRRYANWFSSGGEFCRFSSERRGRSLE